MQVEPALRAATIVALVAACGSNRPAQNGDLAAPDLATAGSLDLSSGGADLSSGGADLSSGGADLSSGGADLSSACSGSDLGGCTAPITGSDSCCAGLHCNATHACTASCGFAGATCASSAECCYNLWCDPAGTHCRGCFGAGRQAAGQPCPGGNGDCCSNSCGAGGLCTL
jgi:hypothetical protein